MKKRSSNTKVGLVYMTGFLAVLVFMIALGIIQNGYEDNAGAIITLIVVVFLLTVLLIAAIREK